MTMTDLIMLPNSKKLQGHIAFESFVCLFVDLSISLSCFDLVSQIYLVNEVFEPGP